MRSATLDSPLRRLLLWMFSSPATPYMSLNVAIDFTESSAYLRSLSAASAPPTVQHLLCAAIGRAIRDFPEANTRVVGARIVPYPSIGIAMPVNLLGHPGGAAQEVGFVVVPDVQEKTLLDIAAHTRRDVAAERDGNQKNEFAKVLWSAARVLPQSLFSGTLNLTARALHSEPLSKLLFRLLPASTLLTNVGAAIRIPDGVLTRGATAIIPFRVAAFATAWASGPVQNEVIALHGKPEVRPMMPLALWFDHRIFDGVLASRLVARVAEILKNPAQEFGSDGRGARVGSGTTGGDRDSVPAASTREGDA